MALTVDVPARAPAKSSSVPPKGWHDATVGMIVLKEDGFPVTLTWKFKPHRKVYSLDQILEKEKDMASLLHTLGFSGRTVSIQEDLFGFAARIKVRTRNGEDAFVAEVQPIRETEEG